MSDEQVQRDVADIRVIVAETRIRVRGIARAVNSQDREIADLRRRVEAGDRWRYKMLGAGVVLVFLLNAGMAWVMR